MSSIQMKEEPDDRLPLTPETGIPMMPETRIPVTPDDRVLVTNTSPSPSRANNNNVSANSENKYRLPDEEDIWKTEQTLNNQPRPFLSNSCDNSQNAISVIPVYTSLDQTNANSSPANGTTESCAGSETIGRSDQPPPDALISDPTDDACPNAVPDENCEISDFNSADSSMDDMNDSTFMPSESPSFLPEQSGQMNLTAAVKDDDGLISREIIGDESHSGQPQQVDEAVSSHLEIQNDHTVESDNIASEKEKENNCALNRYDDTASDDKCKKSGGATADPGLSDNGELTKLGEKLDDIKSGNLGRSNRLGSSRLPDCVVSSTPRPRIHSDNTGMDRLFGHSSPCQSRESKSPFRERFSDNIDSAGNRMHSGSFSERSGPSSVNFGKLPSLDRTNPGTNTNNILSQDESTAPLSLPSLTSCSKSYDYLLKVLLVGDSDVGKQEIITGMEDGSMDSPYTSTGGAAYKTTIILIDGKKVKLHIWDTSGQGRFCTIIRSYSRGAQGILLVYDITNRWSFEGIDRWVREVEEHAPGIPKVLVGNRLHLAFKRQVDPLEAETYAQKHNMGFYEISPLVNFNITESFQELCRMALKRNGMERLWRGNRVLTLHEMCCHAIVNNTNVYGIDKLPLPDAVKANLKSYAMTSYPVNRHTFKSWKERKKKLKKEEGAAKISNCVNATRKSCVIS